MSIRIETRADGQAYPIIVCEQCSEQIDQPADAVVLWPQQTDQMTSDHRARARYVHRSCREEYERTMQPPAGCQWAHGSCALHLIAFYHNATHRVEDSQQSHEALAGRD